MSRFQNYHWFFYSVCHSSLVTTISLSGTNLNINAFLTYFLSPEVYIQGNWNIFEECLNKKILLKMDKMLKSIKNDKFETTDYLTLR